MENKNPKCAHPSTEDEFQSWLADLRELNRLSERIRGISNLLIGTLEKAEEKRKAFIGWLDDADRKNKEMGET